MTGRSAAIVLRRTSRKPRGDALSAWPPGEVPQVAGLTWQQAWWALACATLVVGGLQVLLVQWPYYRFVLHVAYQLPLTLGDHGLLVATLAVQSLPLWLPGVALALVLARFGWRRGAWLVWCLWAALLTFWVLAESFVGRRFGMHAWAYLEFATNPANPLEWVGEDRGLIARGIGTLLVSLLLGPAVAWGAVRAAPRVAQRYPGLVARRGAVGALCGSALALAIVWPSPRWFSTPAVYERFAGALPVQALWLAEPLPPPPELAEFRRQIERFAAPTVARLAPCWLSAQPLDQGGLAPRSAAGSPLPNVVVIVLESFRHNVVNDEVMPRLAAWQRQGLVLERHYAGSNRSQYGLYGLLFARHPLTYGAVVGSRLAPQFCATFQAAGYRTTYLASAETQWALMDSFINPRTFDELVIDTQGSWPERDRRILGRLAERLRLAGDRPQLCFAFLMSTHYNYQYPAEFARFQPAAEFGEVTDFVAGDWNRPQDRAALLNRYQNAAAFLDHELGRFFEQIDLERTLVVVTGDHGESLFEDGTLTHSSRLSEIQLRVPCAVVGPGIKPREVRVATTHADILPTLVEAVAGPERPISFVAGRSLLRADPAEDQVLLYQANFGQEPELLLVRQAERLHAVWSRDLTRLAVRGLLDEAGRPAENLPKAVAPAEIWGPALVAELERAMGGSSAADYVLATHALARGDQRQARRLFEAAAADGMLDEAANDLAWDLIAHEPRQPERALALVERALGHEPGNLAYLDTQGEVLLALERWDQARAVYRRLLEARPDDSRLHELWRRIPAQPGHR